MVASKVHFVDCWLIMVYGLETDRWIEVLICSTTSIMLSLMMTPEVMIVSVLNPGDYRKSWNEMERRMESK